MHKNDYKTKSAIEWDGSPSYFDSKEFASLCLKVVGYIRQANKQGIEATFRFLRENIEENQWLFEAVEHCKRAGLIEAKGSAVRTVFTVGGKEMKPDARQGYSKAISVTASPSENKTLPDYFFENCNRI